MTGEVLWDGKVPKTTGKRRQSSVGQRYLCHFEIIIGFGFFFYFGLELLNLVHGGSGEVVEWASRGDVFDEDAVNPLKKKNEEERETHQARHMLWQQIHDQSTFNRNIIYIYISVCVYIFIYIKIKHGTNKLSLSLLFSTNISDEKI